MTVMITCKDISLEYPTKTVLENVTLGIDSGARIGIVGENGTGKTTLLRVLSGNEAPDHGQVLANGSNTIGLLAQHDTFDENLLVEEILAQSNADIAAYTWQSDARARSIAKALLDGIPLDTTVGTLSGGQRRRLDLARLLIGEWDILALDEPTNHLDIATINWLAQHLKQRWPTGNGALLVVTHDRWFLDEVCTNMWEVYEGSVLSFEGGYAAYTMQRVERARLASVAKQKRENQLRKELAWLSRGAQARRTKPKFHVEAAQALIADVPPVRDSIKLAAIATSRLGKQVFELNDVCVDRNGKRILNEITWNIGPGQRIGILGRNGAGKSTLLGLFSGTIRTSQGHMKVGRTVKRAALTQNLSELLPIEDDIVRVVCSRYKTYYEVEGHKLSPTKLLERMGFTHESLNARVKDLSGGQRRRLQLLLTLLDEPNVLILDEPGNDLDTDMLAATEDLLDSWPGTLIVVSHDRHFLERVTDNLYAIIQGRIRHMPGGIDEYLACEEVLSKADTQPQPKAQAANKATRGTADEQEHVPALLPTDATNSVLTNAERHRMRKQVSSLERRIDKQQQRVAEAQQALDASNPFDYEALANAQRELETQREVLYTLESEWIELSEALENG